MPGHPPNDHTIPRPDHTGELMGMETTGKDPEDQARSVSRRKVLKRIGAGAVVAWSTPILTSIRAPAYAASPPPPPPCDWSVWVGLCAAQYTTGKCRGQ